MEKVLMTLDELFEEVLKLSDEDKKALLVEKATALDPVLVQLTDRNVNGYTLLASFILGAVIADGKITLEEVAVSKKLYNDFFKDKADKQDIVRMARGFETLEDVNDNLKSMLNLLGGYDVTVKQDILTVCACILAIDGVISDSEKAWLAELAK